MYCPNTIKISSLNKDDNIRYLSELVNLLEPIM
jgi:hypothetical protein